MSWNLIAYMFYLPLALFITFGVGKMFHKHGIHYILDMFGGQEDISHSVNNLLLYGYYLLNGGYAAMMLRFWGEMTGWLDVIEALAMYLGTIIMILAVMHYINLSVIYLIRKRINKITPSADARRGAEAQRKYLK